MLIKIEAIVREEKMEDVKAALNEIQVNGFTVTQIMGCGTQRGYTEYVRGSKIDVFLKPKIKFEIVVSSEDWEIKVIDAVQKAAFTGDPGDGKIFSYEIRNAVRIRTGETGYDALQSEFLYNNKDIKKILLEKLRYSDFQKDFLQIINNSLTLI